MKKFYEDPELELIRFEAIDIITDSSNVTEKCTGYEDIYGDGAACTPCDDTCVTD